MLKGVTYLSSDLNKLVCLTWDNVHYQINIVLKRCKLKISPEKKIGFLKLFQPSVFPLCQSHFLFPFLLLSNIAFLYVYLLPLSLVFICITSRCLFSICQILPFSLPFHLSNKTFLFDFSFVYICHGKMGLARVWTVLHDFESSACLYLTSNNYQ